MVPVKCIKPRPSFFPPQVVKAVICSRAVVVIVDLLFIVAPIVCGSFVFGLVLYVLLVLQSSCLGRESWFLCFICLSDVL